MADPVRYSVTAIDGKAAKTLALWELQDMLKNAGRVVKLSIRRGSRSFDCELSLRGLV